MKHFKLFFACALMSLFSLGQVWAVDYEVVYTLDGTITEGQGNSNYEQTGSGCTQDGIKWMVVGNTTTSPWRIGGKSIDGVDRTFTATDALSGNIVKVEIEHGTASNITVNSMTVEVATDADFTDIISTCTPTFAAEDVVVVNHPDGDDAWSNCYYRITYNLTNTTSSNRFVQFKNAKFYREKSASEPSLSADPVLVDFGTVEVGASVTSQAVAVTFANLTGSVTYSGLSDPFSASGVISATGDEITISADATNAGTFEQTLTIQSAADSKSVEVTVKMKVAAPTGTFELYSGDITEGDYVICSGAKAMKNVATSSPRIDVADVTISEDKIVNPDESVIWKFEALTGDDAGYWTFYNEAVSKYAAFNGTDGRGTLIDAVTDYAKFNHVDATSYDFQNKGKTGKYLRYNNGYGFASYGNTTGVALTLYKKSNGKSAAGLAYDAADAQKLVKVGGSLDAPTLTNPNSLTVSYASGNTDVIEVNASTGAITAIKAAGKAVITAYTDGDATHNPGSASYTIFVAEQAGTNADPLTETSAKALIDNGCTLTAHVTGTIATATYNSTYFNYAVTLTDGFQFFRLKDLSGADFSSDYLKAGDEVTAVGALKKFSSTYELDEGCYLTAYTPGSTAVTGVNLTESTAEVEVGSIVTLHASVEPISATDKAIVWSVTSGSDKASVDADGIVTGVAAGEAVIRAASHEDESIYQECTVTVTAVDPTKHTVTFDATVDKTTEATELSITKGDLTIAVTSGEGRFNNGTDYRPYKNAVFTVSCSAGNITKIEFTCTSSKPISGFEDPEVGSLAKDGYNGVWTGNAASVSFTASGAQVQMTQLVITYKEDARPAADLAWDPSDDIELTVGDVFTAPTLLNPNSIDAAEITIESSNPSVATVTAGVVALVADATGTTTITATFAGNASYKPATVSYDITVNPAALTDYYEKVTETAGIVEGTYLIVYEEGSLAFDGSLATLDAESNTIPVTIVGGNKIGVTSTTEASTFYIDPAAGTVKSASDHYIGVSSWGNGLKQTDTYVHNVLEIDGDENAQVGIYNADWNTTGGTMRLQYNKSAGQTRFRYYKNGGQQPIALYKLHDEVIKPAAGLAWDPSDDIELTVGDAFTAPTLLNPNSIDAAEITIESSNPSVATVTAGVVALVADATGTTTITATFAGNASYKPATVSYKIKVNPAHSIYVSPSLTVNFGSVEKDATIDDKVITVTLTNVAAATATLGGTNPEVFSIDPASPAALTASGDITISASSATAGTYNATLTISDDAGEATTRVVTLKLTVTAPETPDDLSGTWTLASTVAVGDKIIIGGTYNSVTKTIGAQNGNNRLAVESTLAEDVLTPGAGTKVFTLVDAGDGKFAIQASNGKYLSASGTGTKNYLTEAADYDADNARWSISISEGVASVVALSSNRNAMQYNKSGDGLFACYADVTSQTAINIYKHGTVTPTTVRSGLTAGNYYTICYPKAMTNITGATLWSFVGKDADFAYIEQETATTIEAGKPYILYATASTVTAELSGDDAAAGTNGAIHGTMVAMDQDALTAAATTAGDDLYLVIGNELRRATGASTSGNSLPAQRAYVVLNEITGGKPASAPGKNVRSMPMHKDTATGIDDLNATDAPRKIMIEGQLFILRGEKVFDATGRLVK